MLLLLVIIVHGAFTKGVRKWAQLFANTTLWLFFAFQLKILATVQPASVKLVLKTISNVTAFFLYIYTFNLQSNCFFVFILLIKVKELPCYCTWFFFFVRTQWSPIRPLIIRMIKQIATPTETQQIRRRSPDLFNREWKYRPDWTTDEVMLPINHNYNKIFDKAVLKLTWYAIYSQIFC